MRRLSLLLILTAQVLFCYSQGAYDVLLKASALRSQGETSEAIRLLSSALLSAPDAELFCERGECYLNSGMLSESGSDFMSAERLKPGSGLFGLAKVSAVSGDASAAVKFLESLMKTEYKKTEPEINSEKSFDNIATKPEWREFWKKEWYKGYEKSKWQIEYYIKNGRLELAREEYAELSSLYPDTDIEEYCASLIDIASGKCDDAIKRLSAVILKGDTSPDFNVALAKAYEDAGNYYAASSEYSKLIAAEYNDASVFLSRALMLRKAGDRDAALNDIEKYLSWYPQDSRALSLMGTTLAENGSLYQALTFMNRNIELHPGEALAYSERGDVYFSSSSWENAIADYSMSLDLDPSNGGVFLNMARAMINKGDVNSACPFLRKALELGEKEAAKYLNRYCR